MKYGLFGSAWLKNVKKKGGAHPLLDFAYTELSWASTVD